jgi:hypothetical protein
MAHIMTQNNTKIQGKFYPLQHDEWLRACRDLTPAQRDVLYYIRTLDPYNQGVEINCAEIARKLSGTERIVHRQTVSRALKELDAKEFIDLELLQVKTKVKPKGLWCDDALQVYGDNQGVMTHHRCDDAPQVYGDNQGVMTHPRCDDAPSAIATHHAGSPHTTVDHDAPSAIATHHATVESLVERESYDSKINKTYLDFIKTLSEEERANFLEFCREKTKNLSQEVNDIEAWLAHQNRAGQNRWEVYYQKFTSSQLKPENKPDKNASARRQFQQWRQEMKEKERIAEEMARQESHFP